MSQMAENRLLIGPHCEPDPENRLLIGPHCEPNSGEWASYRSSL